MLLNSIRSHSFLLLLCISVLVTSAYGDCGPPPVKPKTLPIEGTSFKTGTTVDYSCNNNLGYYDIPGMSTTIICLAIAQWSDVLEFCQRACGLPPTLKEARMKPEYINNNYFLENDTVQYDCRFGFVPIAGRKNTLTCLSSLTWSTSEEFCKRRSCPSLSNIENGYFEAKDFLFGTRASYYCNKGYRMIPATHSRLCKGDGTWSNGEPVCNGDCGPPPVKPKTLPIEGTSFKTGTTVDYSCNNTLGYYDIPGMSRTITCLAIAQWSDVLEFCQRACGLPQTLTEARLRPEYISNNYFIENATVQYECRFGFVPITGRKNTLTCLTNLTWSTPEEFCKRRSCPSLSNIENGYFEAKDFLFGTRASYYCNKGYRMIPATHSRLCKGDGTWSKGEPVCNGVICAKPDSIPNGSYTPVKDEYRYPDPVTYSCNENFTFIGTSNISCGSDGTWSPEAPKCIDFVLYTDLQALDKMST